MELKRPNSVGICPEIVLFLKLSRDNESSHDNSTGKVPAMLFSRKSNSLRTPTSSHKIQKPNHVHSPSSLNQPSDITQFGPFVLKNKVAKT